MDLATDLGEQGFRWVFIVNGHGDPHHNAALDAAGDYFRDAYGYSSMILGIPGVAEVMDASTKHDAEIETREREWIAAHARRP
jgi:creatinine amidohydrolase